MGRFSPTNAALGKLYTLDKGVLNQTISNLQRPVHASYADLNSDNTKEIIISEYGQWTGALSMWTSDKENNYKRTNIDSKPGCIKTIIRDHDKDGNKDIYALYGHGDEEIVVYINKGKGQFKKETLLEFRPSQGSSYFDMIDIDHDGDEDIVYTAGDNADYPSPPKPYHGIYIYENNGAGNFIQSHFYHLPGAYKAIVLKDEEMATNKIFAISFFPNYNQKQPTVACTIDISNGSMTKYPVHKQGRWIVADCQEDKKQGHKCVLGSLTMEVPDNPNILHGWIESGISAMTIHIDD